MWTHYGKIRDEIDRRVKTLESASDKYGKEAARQMQDTVYAAFAQWQLGGMDGGAVLNSLHAAASMGVIPPEKYVNMLNDVTFGNDSTPDNPATKELYKQAQKMFDDIGVDADRQYELLESLRNMRTAGKSQEEIREQINTFRDTETAGFLTRALSSIGAGQGVREADVKDIIKYGAAGRLDNYFVQRYTTNAYMDADGGLVSGKERMIVGDDERMTAIMQAAGAEALSQISRITGVPESRITGREAAGSDGDKKGSFEYNVDGAPMRLNVDDKNRYFVEKREGGKWIPYTTAKKGVPPWSAYGSNGAGSPYNPYNNNAGGSP
jgi:hypothetical protein